MMQQQQLLNSQQTDFAALLEREYSYVHPRRGDVRKATILSIGDNDILVDLKGKRDGVILPKDLDNVDETYVEDLAVGDRVPVQILRVSREHGGVLVSLKRGLEQSDWLRAEELLDDESVVEAEVVEVNRGGILVQFGNLQGFVPNSHLTSLPSALRHQEFQEAKEALVGRTLSLVVLEVNQRRGRLILSERVASHKRREELLQALHEGDVRKGIVRNIVDFGVFVDLGGIDGLIHISELAWDYVEDPNAIVEIGDEIEIYVLRVDRERGRIGLSRKRVIPVSETKVDPSVAAQAVEAA